MLRISRVEVEQVVPFQLEQRLRDRKLSRVSHRDRHVIELRRIIDRAKEARQIVEKGVVTSAHKDLDGLSAGSRDGFARI